MRACGSDGLNVFAEVRSQLKMLSGSVTHISVQLRFGGQKVHNIFVVLR